MKSKHVLPPSRPRRHQFAHLPLLIVSLLASFLIIYGVQYYISEEGIDALESSAAAAAIAPWGPEDGNADPIRQQAVRNAMIHAWHSYEKYAWGADELKPYTKEGKFGVLGGMNGFSGMGASIIDAMSTLYVMELHKEFERAHAWIAENMTFTPRQEQEISFFETTIRLLGGLLAAHDLAGHRLFLDKAHDLGTRLLPVFDGVETGILINSAKLPETPVQNQDYDVLLAEAGSNLIEFGTLAARTGNETFRDKAESGMRFLHAKYPDRPLLGTSVSRKSGEVWDGKKTVGAPVDSYFEYLLKYWILRGKKDSHWRDRWVNATKAALDELIVRPNNVNFTFTGELPEYSGTQPRSTISHLGCFYPGNVALGVLSGAVQGPLAEKFLDFAKSMMHACYQLYNGTSTGIGADQMDVDIATGTLSISSAPYLQRPEVVESLFYLWRTTHDEIYREWGWKIFQAIEKHCRHEGGYSGAIDAGTDPVVSDNVQQSWFLAETLKYLYLLFSDDSVVRLDEWVFNTEAHPVRVEVVEEEGQWVDWQWMVPSWMIGGERDDESRSHSGVVFRKRKNPWLVVMNGDGGMNGQKISVW